MYNDDPSHINSSPNRKTYLGMVTAMDEGIGSVVSKLVQRGFWENTLFVFTSDNGGDVAEKGADNYPLRGAKASTYEGGVRTAGFIAGGAVPSCASGRRLSGMVHVADFMATFGWLAGYTTVDERAEKAGLPPSDSVNFWPYLMGTRKTSSRQEVSIKGGKNGRTLIKVIDGTIYKYISGQIWEGKKVSTTAALYDLSDLRESKSLENKKPSVFNEMKRRATEIDKTEYQAFSQLPPKPDKDAKAAVTSKYGGHWGPWVATPTATPTAPPTATLSASPTAAVPTQAPTTASSTASPTATPTSAVAADDIAPVEQQYEWLLKSDESGAMPYLACVSADKAPLIEIIEKKSSRRCRLFCTDECWGFNFDKESRTCLLYRKPITGLLQGSSNQNRCYYKSPFNV